MKGGAKTGIEIIRPAAGRSFSCALMDFDGTISLIRQGWQDVMIPMMVEILSGLEHGLSDSQLQDLVREDVTVLTGEQTIYQMIRLAERVQQFGGTPAEPLEYKEQYHRRLMERIDGRRQDLASGKCPPEEMLLPGAGQMLQALRARGLKLYLTSGTDEPYVVEEARLLDVERYFDGGIHGARDDYKTHTKAAVIGRMLSDNRIAGPELLGIGDGFVEITNTRQVGGYAVGVASDEAHRSGAADAWKRRRLLEAGADMIVPDFAQTDAILAALFGSGS